MRIVLIGPGLQVIPPVGWGAVEALIADWNDELFARGHQMEVLNTSDRSELVRRVNELQPDIVHFHADRFLDTIPRLSS